MHKKKKATRDATRNTYYSNYKLYPHEVVEIRILTNYSDYTRKQVARRYKVSPSHISNIHAYRFWKDL